MLATLESKIIAVFAVFGLLAIMLGVGYLYGEKAQKTKDALATAQEHLAIAKVIQTATDENDALKTRLEVEHENDVKALNTVMSVPIPRVYLPARSCIDKANAASGSQQSEPASGVLPTEAEGILAADRQRTWGIIGEAENELADCRVAKNWAASQIQ